MSKSEYGLLSDREEQVLLLSTKGLTDKEIARKLDLSIATVNTYWVRIRTKLGGANRAELVAAALNKNAEETLTAKERENQRLISEVVRRAEAEKALHESQSKLQSIIDGTPLIIFIKDLQGRYTLVNKEFEALVGKERKEILMKRDYDVFPLHAAERSRALDQQVIESGEPVESEGTYEADEKGRYFLTVRFPLFDTEGEIYGVCGFSREITSRIEFEQQLQKSEQRFRSLIENSTDLVTLLAKDGTILYMSPSSKRVLGFPPDELVGKNAFRYIVREDISAIKRDFDHLIAKAGNTVEGSYRVKHADGSFRYVEGRGANLLDEEAVGAVVVNYRDVTDLMHTTRTVEEERQRYRDLFEQAPDGYVVTNLKGHILEANKAALELFGCEETDCVGKSLKDFVVQDLKNAFSAGFASLPELDSIHEWELKIRPANAPVFDASISVAVVRGPKGEPTAHRWLIRDISSPEFVEHELKVANEALDRRVRTRTIELEETNLRLKEEVGERKRAEEDLLNSHQFAQSVIESSVDGIMA